MTVAPFVRPLQTGPPLETGKDVTAIQRALRAAGTLTKPVTAAAYAQNTWEAVQAFQREASIQPTGNYGRPTHIALTPFFDDYGKWLLTEAADDLKAEPREKVVNAAWWYYGVRSGIAYSQARPIQTVYFGLRPPAVPDHLDCSGFSITAYWVAGLAYALGDANSHGWGNTWSLSQNGKAISKSELRPADLVFYGNCSHVAVYVGQGNVLSMGSYPIKFLPVNYRSDYWGARSYLP